MTKKVLRIGFSACFFHADPQRAIFKGKTLLYLEESMAKWLMRHGAIPVLLPRPGGTFGFKDLLSQVDGLILQGGSDVAPQTYAEEPLNPDWAGDAIRDQYEAGLIQTAMKMDQPILGICRGPQMLNVALGGTLYQDISSQNKSAGTHRDWSIYDDLNHGIDILPGSLLEKMYPNLPADIRVNSVHHQAIKDLADDLVIEARSIPDQVIEAVRHRSAEKFIYGVQWHPEFQNTQDKNLLDPNPLMDSFLQEVRKRC